MSRIHVDGKAAGVSRKYDDLESMLEFSLGSCFLVLIPSVSLSLSLSDPPVLRSDSTQDLARLSKSIESSCSRKFSRPGAFGLIGDYHKLRIAVNSIS